MQRCKVVKDATMSNVKAFQKKQPPNHCNALLHVLYTLLRVCGQFGIFHQKVFLGENVFLSSPDILHHCRPKNAQMPAETLKLNLCTEKMVRLIHNWWNRPWRRRSKIMFYKSQCGKRCSGGQIMRYTMQATIQCSASKEPRCVGTRMHD